MSYAGGKNGSGVYQKIINLMPPHTVYIEPFIGGGAIMRQKKRAWRNIGVDMDEKALKLHENHSEIEKIKGCGIKFLENYDYKGGELIYCDPPYPHSTRTKSKLYNFEMTDKDHKRLLEAIKELPCMVMISSYRNKLYAKELKDWNYTSFQAMTRGGVREESLWFNFNEPDVLHDYSFLGDGFRERERIKRKKDRFVKKLKSMPKLERQAILAGIDEAGIIYR